jgi:hypothetical protein
MYALLPPVRGLTVLFSILALGLVSTAPDALARDSGVRKAFQRGHPCPSTGRKTGACPGYVVDHIRPLCAGGPDGVPPYALSELLVLGALLSNRLTGAVTEWFASRACVG